MFVAISKLNQNCYSYHAKIKKIKGQTNLTKRGLTKIKRVLGKRPTRIFWHKAFDPNVNRYLNSALLMLRPKRTRKDTKMKEYYKLTMASSSQQYSRFIDRGDAALYTRDYPRYYLKKGAIFNLQLLTEYELNTVCFAETLLFCLRG